MEGITFKLKGSYGHFKKPETNDNPSTYSYMHKVAIIGLIGAVNGIGRGDMRPLYPQLCDDFLFSIKILNPIEKEPHGFTKRKVFSKFSFTEKNFDNKFLATGRRFCEYLREIEYDIIIALKNKGSESEEVFNEFKENMKNGRTVYDTSFGNADCPAYSSDVREITVSDEEYNGEFETEFVFSAEHALNTTDPVDFIFEWVPVYVENGHYKQTIQTVCFQATPVKVTGPYRKTDGGRNIWLM